MCEISANLSRVKHESVQHQTVKTASGYIWRRITQFPWKPGNRDNCCGEELWLWLSPHHLSSPSFTEASDPEIPHISSSRLGLRWGQRSLTGRASHTATAAKSFNWPEAERGVLCGGWSWLTQQYSLFFNIGTCHSHTGCTKTTESNL